MLLEQLLYFGCLSCSEVKIICNMTLWNDERMALSDRERVSDYKAVISLVDDKIGEELIDVSVKRRKYIGYHNRYVFRH